MAPAPLGIAEAGDRYYFANGRREQVTAVESGVLDIRRSSKYQYQRFQDFVLADKTVKKQGIVVESELMDLTPAESLWPLQIGKKVSFGVVNAGSKSNVGNSATKRKEWECIVNGMQSVGVISGNFDTYRIECVRKNSRNKIKQRVTHYYAPSIQQVVLRMDNYTYKPAKKLELVAFNPALTRLSKGSQRLYRQHFQNTMEMKASGTTTSWWSRRTDTRIHTTPTSTRKIGADLYCRNYLVRIQSKELLRSGAGLVCRDKNGKWRIPRKIDADKGRVTF